VGVLESRRARSLTQALFNSEVGLHPRHTRAAECLFLITKFLVSLTARTTGWIVNPVLRELMSSSVALCRRALSGAKSACRPFRLHSTGLDQIDDTMDNNRRNGTHYGENDTGLRRRRYATLDQLKRPCIHREPSFSISTTLAGCVGK
jgi:hypothetical protein